MARKYSITTLRNRLARLEESLYKEKLRLHKVNENMGWGAGMRRTKCTPSFRREDELKEKIRAVEAQIEELEANGA